eukprot:Gb_40525 [translate_table: standard]
MLTVCTRRIFLNLRNIRIDSESSDRDPSPSTPSHSLEDEDSPPNSPTASPLWKSVRFQESLADSTLNSSPNSLDLLGSDHDSDSSDKTPEQIPKVKDSSSNTDSESSDRDPSPSTPGHSSEDEDSPPDSPTVGPL